ncbi:sensor histidine kinase [Streptomyces sp. KL116D]|uniref:sensor histidine kinase n=1 Tax=Streptomyces sp. KL116D TaxID=3045152 RepID=UPI00355706B5
MAEERLRIARELHDLVAHQITLANAQATVAAHLFDSRPSRPARVSANSSRPPATRARRPTATVGSAAPVGDPAAPGEPAPGLSQPPTLLDSFRRAGLHVSLHEEGTARPLPPGVDLTAYRIVQEALTNVTKHAGTTCTAQVRLVWLSEQRDPLTVVDDGNGGATRTGRTGHPATV